jgi:hypothetical protein
MAVLKYKCKKHGSRNVRNGFSEKGEPVKSSNACRSSGIPRGCSSSLPHMRFVPSFETRVVGGTAYTSGRSTSRIDGCCSSREDARRFQMRSVWRCVSNRH